MFKGKVRLALTLVAHKLLVWPKIGLKRSFPRI